MDLSVIENDPKEVKKYLQNFVPINYYRVLDDSYLYQVRAVLLHSVSHAELYNPVYAGLINDLTVTSGQNYATINTKLEVITDNFSALATKTETLEVEAANANASIIEIQQASAEQNKAQASVNERLEASLDDIVVGGRNIMKNSDFSKGYRAWQEASITTHNHFIGTMHKISTTGIVGSLMGIYPLAEYQNMAMVEGSQYSISFYAYGSILLMDEIYLTSASEAPIKLPSVVISTDLTDRRHITFKAPTGGGGLGLIFGATATSEDDWFSISRIKVELGNKPTDWTPAPEDVEGYINEVQSSIDTFKDVQVERNLATAQTIEQIDTRVKGNAASILEEKNTRVDQFSALSQVTNELLSKTNENEAAIKSVDMTFTDRYNANVSRLGVLEADNSLGKGKIENLESVTTSLGEVVVTQGSTLNAKINNLTMGGRNLLRNSDFKLGADTWGTSEISYDESIFGNLTTVTNTGTTTNYFGLTPVNIFKTVTLIKDKEYILSFYAKGNIPSINDIWITTEGELPQQLDSVDITDGISDRYSIVFTANHTTEAGSIIIGASGYAKDKWFAVAAVKLEIGNKATDWTEAPEDTKAFIHDVEANINEFKEVQVNYNEATTTVINTMESTLGENSAKIVENFNTLASEDEAITNLYTSLNADYGLNKTKVSNEINAVADDVSASVEIINTLRTEFDSNKTGVDSSIKSLADENKAQTERMDNLYADIGDNSAAIASEVLVRTSAVEAVANTVTALDSKFEDNKTSVTQSLGTLTTKDTALSNQLTDLTSTVDTNTANITANNNTLVASDKAIADSVTALDAKYEDNKSSVSSQLTALVDKDTATANQLTALDTDYKGNKTAVSNSLTSLTNADTALGSRITTLDTDYKGNKTAIRNELTAVSDKTNSTASSLTSLTSVVGKNTTAISTEATTRSTEDTALSNRITTVSGKTDNALSRITTAETTIANNTGAIAQAKIDLKADFITGLSDLGTNNYYPKEYIAKASSWGTGSYKPLLRGIQLEPNTEYTFYVEKINTPHTIVISVTGLVGLNRFYHGGVDGLVVNNYKQVFTTDSTGLVNLSVYGATTQLDTYLYKPQIFKGTIKPEYTVSEQDFKDGLIKWRNYLPSNALADSDNFSNAAYKRFRHVITLEPNTVYTFKIGKLSKFTNQIVPRILDATPIDYPSNIDGTLVTIFNRQGSEAEKDLTRVFTAPASGRISFEIYGASSFAKSIFNELQIYKGTESVEWSPSFEDSTLLAEKNSAAITSESTARATAVGAVASSVATLQTTVSGNTASISETRTSLNGLSSRWSMETNVNGKVSGIYQHSTGKSSGLDIITDKFTLSNGTNAGYAPFRQEGNTTYLNMAVIKEASLDLAKINKASITNLQALTANIGHFKSATTGARLEIQDSLLSVYDANNKLRVRLGIW